MIVPLREAAADTCGGKAGTLGALLRAGLPVPDGFVIPFAAYREHVRAAGEPAPEAIEARPLGAALAAALGRALGDAPVAVRSSASDEDTGQASAAGQHESFLAVRGAGAVETAVRACWASLFSPRAVGYRGGSGRGDPAMAVIVQRHLDAEVSGVMFTPAHSGDPTRIEASFGLGPSVVEGRVNPDFYGVAGDGSVTRALADKRIRLDRRGTRLITGDVPAGDRKRPAIDDVAARRLAALGEKTAAVLNGPQDIEWALAADRLWLLQARPITAILPPPPTVTPATGAAKKSPPHSLSGAPDATRSGRAGGFVGTPGSRGSVRGVARIVRGPGDFVRVRPGDILVCPYTDPAWTPLLRIAGGVVTETGGVLSHAAIVAREYAIPAVLGVPDVMSGLRDGAVVTVDGTAGTVTPAN